MRPGASDSADMAVCGVTLRYPTPTLPRDVPTDWSGIEGGAMPCPPSAIAGARTDADALQQELPPRRSEAHGLRFDESLAYCEDEQFIPALPVARRAWVPRCA